MDGAGRRHCGPVLRPDHRIPAQLDHTWETRVRARQRCDAPRIRPESDESGLGSRCEPIAHLGEAQREVGLRQLRDHVPLERRVVRHRSLAVGCPEQDRQRELCRSGAAVSPAEPGR